MHLKSKKLRFCVVEKTFFPNPKTLCAQLFSTLCLLLLLDLPQKLKNDLFVTLKFILAKHTDIQTASAVVE